MDSGTDRHQNKLNLLLPMNRSVASALRSSSTGQDNENCNNEESAAGANE